MNPLVSIVIPVYNAGEHIKPCLDTLTQQTLKEIEIICVLDCPTDGTDKVVEAYAEKDNRIKVVRNEKNQHIGLSRNHGIELATGEYIGFSDHDDYRELTMYEDLYKKAQEEGADIVLSGVLGINANQWEANHTDKWEDRTLNQLVRRRCTTHIHPHLYKTEFLKQNGILFKDNRQYSVEDTLFNAKALSYALAQGKKIATVAHNYYIHVDYQNNQNKSYDHWAFSKMNRTIHEMMDLRSVYPFEAESASEFAYRCLYTSFDRECRKNGFLSAVKLFKNELRKDQEIADLLKLRSTLWESSFTAPKNLFADVLKAML